jgi:hypothetical protein
LATLLVASGVGAGVLMRRGADPRGRLRALTVRLAVILVFVITAYFGLHALLEDTRGAPLPVRLFTAIAVVALFGLPMGTAFPMGLEILTARVPRAAGTLSPWLWAVNGAAGTLASAVSILISIYLGFSACLLLGGAFYLVSLIAAPVFLRRAA